MSMATFRQKIQLLRGLIHGELAFTAPFFANVDVTRRCNMHCLGCQYHSSQTRTPSPGDHAVKDISFELVERLCVELPELGTSEVFLVGEGEPFLHPRLSDIILAFKRAGCKVQVFTNGTLLNESKASQVLDSGLDVLRVSLWANSPEEYAKCHPGANPANLQRTLDGVRLITGLKATSVGYGNLSLWLSRLGLEEWVLPASLAALVVLGVWICRHRRGDLWLRLGVTAIVARIWIYHWLYDDLLILLPMITLFRIAKQEPFRAGDDIVAGALLMLTIIAMMAPARLRFAPWPWQLIFTAGHVLVWGGYWPFCSITRDVQGR